jgi:hypothetical protein
MTQTPVAVTATWSMFAVVPGMRRSCRTAIPCRQRCPGGRRGAPPPPRHVPTCACSAARPWRPGSAHPAVDAERAHRPPVSPYGGRTRAEPTRPAPPRTAPPAPRPPAPPLPELPPPAPAATAGTVPGPQVRQRTVRVARSWTACVPTARSLPQSRQLPANRSHITFCDASRIGPDRSGSVSVTSVLIGTVNRHSAPPTEVPDRVRRTPAADDSRFSCVRTTTRSPVNLTDRHQPAAGGGPMQKHVFRPDTRRRPGADWANRPRCRPAIPEPTRRERTARGPRARTCRAQLTQRQYRMRRGPRMPGELFAGPRRGDVSSRPPRMSGA